MGHAGCRRRTSSRCRAVRESTRWCATRRRRKRRRMRGVPGNAGFSAPRSTSPGLRFSDAAFRPGFARIVTHFFAHGAWFDADQVLRQVDRMAHIPCTLIHCHFDPSCPLRSPWELAQTRPKARLQILAGASQSALAEDMRAHIRAATDTLEIKGNSRAGSNFGTRTPPFLCTPVSHGDETSGALKSDSPVDQYTDEPGPVRPVGKEGP